MKVISCISLIITITVSYTIPVVIYAYNNNHHYRYINRTQDNDNMQPTETVVQVYDEELPLSNAALYSDALSPLSSFISAAIKLTVTVTLIVFGTLFLRKTIIDKLNNTGKNKH